MQTQQHLKTKTVTPSKAPLSESDTEVLDSSQFFYMDGLSENVDWFRHHLTPYDIQDDAQEFYNRVITRK